MNHVIILALYLIILCNCSTSEPYYQKDIEYHNKDGQYKIKNNDHKESFKASTKPLNYKQTDSRLELYDSGPTYFKARAKFKGSNPLMLTKENELLIKKGFKSEVISKDLTLNRKIAQINVNSASFNHKNLASTKNHKIRNYKVKFGDTLSSISKKFYKSTKYLDQLASFNKINSNKIYAEQTIKVPNLKMLPKLK